MAVSLYVSIQTAELGARGSMSWIGRPRAVSRHFPPLAAWKLRRAIRCSMPSQCPRPLLPSLLKTRDRWSSSPSRIFGLWCGMARSMCGHPGTGRECFFTPMHLLQTLPTGFRCGRMSRTTRSITLTLQKSSVLLVLRSSCRKVVRECCVLLTTAEGLIRPLSMDTCRRMLSGRLSGVSGPTLTLDRLRERL